MSPVNFENFYDINPIPSSTFCVHVDTKATSARTWGLLPKPRDVQESRDLRRSRSLSYQIVFIFSNHWTP